MGGETMSAERTPAEVVKDPAGDIISPRIQYLEEWIRDCQRYNRNVSAKLTGAEDRIRDLESLLEAKNTNLREAAALIERLTGQNEHAARVIRDRDEWNVHLANENSLLKAALPDCPTCGGKGTFTTASTRGHYETDELPCPDCDDGHVSPAQLAALWQAVHDVDYVHPAFLPAPNGVKEAWVAGAQSVYRHLRAVRPT